MAQKKLEQTEKKRSFLFEFMNEHLKLIKAQKFQLLNRILESHYGSSLSKIDDYNLLINEFKKYKGFKEFIEYVKKSNEFYESYVRPDEFYNEYSHNKVSLNRKVDYTDAY